MDDKLEKCTQDVGLRETERNESIKEIGNLLHESVIISNDEVLSTF